MNNSASLNTKKSNSNGHNPDRISSLEHLEQALRAIDAPKPPTELHNDIMAAVGIKCQIGHIHTHSYTRFRPLALAAAAALILLAWTPLSHQLRRHRLMRSIEAGNRLLVEYFGREPLSGPAALEREGELLLADMRQGSKFLMAQLPFGAGLAAAAQSENLPGRVAQ